MDVIICNSSSENEDDEYLNSVARLKALKKQVETSSKEERLKVEEVNPRTSLSMRNNGSMTRRRKKKQLNKNNSTAIRPGKDCCSISDNDLEIVSVETIDKPNSINSKENLNNSVILLCVTDDELSDNENYDIYVKILWRSKTIHRLHIRKYENFQKIFQYFADLENVSIEQILIMRKEKIIDVLDTPALINLSVIDILEGGVVNAGMVIQNNCHNKENKNDEDICNIKVQTANKQLITVPLGKNQQFKIVFISCAQKLDLKESNVKLYFDGEQIHTSDTPESLDLEQEACIDLRISST